MVNFPECLSQAMLVGIILVGRLGVCHPWAPRLRTRTSSRARTLKISEAQKCPEGEAPWNTTNNTTNNNRDPEQGAPRGPSPPLSRSGAEVPLRRSALSVGQ